MTIEQTSDKELARTTRERMLPHLLAICAIIDDAKAHGLVVGFNIAPDPSTGRSHAGDVSVARPL